MIFKVIHERRGGHVHCSLFSAPRPEATWAKCGDLVVRDDELAALRAAMPGVTFVERQTIKQAAWPDADGPKVR